MLITYQLNGNAAPAHQPTFVNAARTAVYCQAAAPGTWGRGTGICRESGVWNKIVSAIIDHESLDPWTLSKKKGFIDHIKVGTAVGILFNNEKSKTFYVSRG